MGRFISIRTCAALVALPLLAACSETSVMDAFNSGKSAPDEGLVATNPPLSMPPDMTLRQPGATAVAPTYQNPPSSNGLQVQQGQRATNTYQAPPPPQPSYQQPVQPQQQQAYQQPGAQPQQQQTYQQPAQQPRNSADDVYTRNGINPYNPDGTRKKQSVLNEELRKKDIERKRASNPNYGTIFNMGELWSGN